MFFNRSLNRSLISSQAPAGISCHQVSSPNSPGGSNGQAHPVQGHMIQEMYHSNTRRLHLVVCLVPTEPRRISWFLLLDQNMVLQPVRYKRLYRYSRLYQRYVHMQPLRPRRCAPHCACDVARGASCASALPPLDRMPFARLGVNFFIM